MDEVYDPQIFYDVATKLYDYAEDLNGYHQTAFGGLSGTGEMAGNCDRGTEFAEEYDELVPELETTGKDLVAALYHYGDIVRQVGINHADAEADSDIGDTGYDEPPAERSAPIGMCFAIPKSAGGSLEGLLEDVGLNEYLTVPVPDGDTDKLAKANSVWTTLSDDIGSNLVGKVSALIADFDDLYGEEIDVICDDLNGLDTEISTYRDGAKDLAEATEQHKGYLDEVREMLEGILKDLAIELAATAAITIAASFVTFGGAAVVGGAKAASTIARFAKRIESIITTVKGFSRFKKFRGMLSRFTKSKGDSKALELLRLEVKNAKPGIRKNNARGRLGEKRAGLDPNAKKRQIEINGRKRYPDKIDDVAEEVVEVKNVDKLSSRDAKQIEDSVDFAAQEGYKTKLFIDERTQKFPARVQKLVDEGKIEVVRMDLN